MEISNIIPHIEALIFASDKPMTVEEITELINTAFAFMEDKVTTEQVETAMEGIMEKYNSEFFPFEVRKSGGGWQFLTKKEYHKTIAQLNGEKFLKRLSAAALETLAIIAYKQPITKGEIELIRGVSADYAIQKLLEKELIIISGRNEQLPGHPLVYNTSRSFMDYFGINSPEDLPKIKEVLAEAGVEPTQVNQADIEQSETLAVSGSGELIDWEEGEADGARLFINGFDHQGNNVSMRSDTDMDAVNGSFDEGRSDLPDEEEQSKPGSQDSTGGEDAKDDNAGEEVE